MGNSKVQALSMPIKQFWGGLRHNKSAEECFYICEITVMARGSMPLATDAAFSYYKIPITRSAHHTSSNAITAFMSL